MDVVRGKLYWADAGLNRIQRADLSGANVETVITGVSWPGGVAVDSGGNGLFLQPGLAFGKTGRCRCRAERECDQCNCGCALNCRNDVHGFYL